MPENGQTISHYRIVEKIGQGGMGEVYLADDTTLDRKVALKFLPEAFTSDPERMARFEREAKLLASLNHPNIAGIYGLEQADGNRFLVLEYVEGETLQSRLSNGALPLEDALALCLQIAEGLEAAHGKGVIHRDLKPANVMITVEEKVKILDFGLAKAFSDDTQSIDSSQSPTLTEAMTRPGVILGTAAYMSPEQAKGKSVDKRADIWAFGCILYECLTGKRAFEGETVTETLASVIKEEPDIEKTPAKTRLLLRQCLVKDRKSRLRDIGDAMALIGSVPESAIKSAPIKGLRLITIWTVLSTVLLLTAVIISFLYLQSRKSSEAKYYDLSLPHILKDYSLAISPDGRYVAYVASTSEGKSSLFVREIFSGESKQLNGTYGARFPFWAPDSSKIGFFSEGRFKIADIAGGRPRVICSALTVYGGTWSKNGEILIATWPVLRLVSETQVDPVEITELDKSKNEICHTFPYFLPDGHHYLYSAFHTGGRTVYVGSLDSKEKKQLPLKTPMAIYTDPGYLLFPRNGSLYARPFDSKKLEFTGEEHRIADNLVSDWREDWAAYSASQSGVLIYRAGKEPENSQFAWFDRDGKQIGLAGEPDKYSLDFDLSPEGNQIATGLGSDIYVLNLQTNVPEQLTNISGVEMFPVWSPGGTQVAFTASPNGNGDLFVKKVGSNEKERALKKATPDGEYMDSWSKDGLSIIYRKDMGKGDAPPFYFLLSGEEEEVPIDPSPSNGYWADFSSNSKWLAYTSMKTGQSEIYVVSLLTGSRRKISKNGGVQPQWREDDKELYYLALDGKLMAVDISLGTEIESGIPHPLFDTNMPVIPDWSRRYAAASDGNKFLILKSNEEKADNPITVVQDWTSRLDQ